MTHRHALAIAGVLLTLLTACTTVTEQEAPQSAEQILALTPTPTLSPTITPSPLPTATPTATQGPTPTPTITPVPSPTPFPPTPTANPALEGFGYCNQTAGDRSAGRFSARLTAIETRSTALIEELTLVFSQPEGAAAINASAACQRGSAFQQQFGLLDPPGNVVIAVDLDGWLHDEEFAATDFAAATAALSGTTIIKSLGFQQPPEPNGATLAVTIEQPRPYRVRVAANPPRLIVEVAKAPALDLASDPLLQESARKPQPARPLFFLRGGDVYRFDGGSSKNLTDTPEAETALAVSRDGKQLAVCQELRGFGDAAYGVPGSLVLMNADGTNQRTLAVGRACADPAFSPDGSRLAWVFDLAGAPPAARTVLTVSVLGGTPESAATGDEWERLAPQWLNDTTLLYQGQAADGRSVLFRASNGDEQEISAGFVRGDRYRAVGPPLVAPDGKLIALEALRAEGTGAALLVIDSTGAIKQELDDPFYSRPLTWDDDGALYYLTTACASDLVNDYELRLLSGSSSRVVSAGRSLSELGSFVAIGKQLAYIAYADPSPGPFGGLRVPERGESSLWLRQVGGEGAAIVQNGEPISNLR